jgi:hypothetical protein
MTSFQRARRPWIVAIVLALGGALAGCGGSSAPLSVKSADSSAPAGGVAAEPAGPGAAPAPFDAGADFEGDAAPPSAAPAPPPMRSDLPAESAAREAPRAEQRPGLGTEWGETRHSRITTVSFRRADPATPFAHAALFYNDRQGARAMAAGSSPSPQREVPVGDGIVTFGLRDGDSGRFLTGFEAGDRDYVIGEAGQRYVIVVQNHAPMRIEVVVSVDGLDVIDGRPASFGKRGYLVDGHGTLEIDGFRQSEEEVAAFRFGSVRDSYASKKTGDSRNVGVIGVALFHEQGTSPSLWRDEVDRRHDADPFPGRFATPPPR